MSFNVNTNITSLQAQNYLRTASDFQAKTINRVTSGLRIVQSGDDAAGLAIANGFRSDQAVLTQGIRNANDGLSTLQTIDGGMNNISQLLDRARTLATQSASDTFTGDRGVLNNEFQSVMTEINRQSQSIGLDTNGDFAKSLSVFIGGGRTNAADSANAITNGSVAVDLSNSSIDTKSLGLTGMATAVSTTDIGTGSAATSVAKLVADPTNLASEKNAGYTTFNFSGPGFADTTGNNKVSVSVNLSGVTDVSTLASAINAAIQTTGSGPSQQATAFKNAGISAGVVTDSNGSHLQFSSGNSAFQVAAGDTMASALMGNIASGQTGTSVAAQTATTNVTAMGANSTNAGAEHVVLNVNLGGTNTKVSLTIGATEARATTVANLQTALDAAGVNVTAALDAGNKLQFTAKNSAQAQDLSVQVSGDSVNALGMGTFQVTGAGPYNFDYTSITAGAAAVAGESQNIQIGIGNQVFNLGALTVAASNGEADMITQLNTAFQGNTAMAAAGLVAKDDGTGNLKIESSNGTHFRLNAYGATGTNVGLGFTDGGVDSSAKGVFTGVMASATADANGTSSSGFLNFNGIKIAGVSQTVTLTAPDTSGTVHPISFSLSSADASDIDAALSKINGQLLQSNDSTLQKIVAVKEQSGGVEGIRFVSSLHSFNVSLGTTALGTGTAANIQGISNGTGASSQGVGVIASTALGTGSNADVSNQVNAKNAVTALANAVKTLGNAQAVVGKGENNFNYAITLAQSQVTNLAAAESRIRDADLAAEAANLSKAQILVQAGTAALAQANSAPQAILSLLRG